jgi:hypothetical protein
MYGRAGESNSTEFWSGGEELSESVSMCVGLRAFRTHPTVNHPVGGRRLRKSLIHGILAQTSQYNLGKTPYS